MKQGLLCLYCYRITNLKLYLFLPGLSCYKWIKAFAWPFPCWTNNWWLLWFTSFFFVLQHKCYIVATVDRDLKRRIRKIPGVPIMYISNHRWDTFLTGNHANWQSCSVSSLLPCTFGLSYIVFSSVCYCIVPNSRCGCIRAYLPLWRKGCWLL